MIRSASIQTRSSANVVPRLGFGGVVAALAARAMEAAQRYRVRRQLHEKPDYLLDDVGLTRSQIDRALDYGAASGRRHSTWRRGSGRKHP